jgi:hypothetical protein
MHVSNVTELSATLDQTRQEMLQAAVRAWNSGGSVPAAASQGAPLEIDTGGFIHYCYNAKSCRPGNDRLLGIRSAYHGEIYLTYSLLNFMYAKCGRMVTVLPELLIMVADRKSREYEGSSVLFHICLKYKVSSC